LSRVEPKLAYTIQLRPPSLVHFDFSLAACLVFFVLMLSVFLSVLYVVSCCLNLCLANENTSEKQTDRKTDKPVNDLRYSGPARHFHLPVDEHSTANDFIVPD